MDLDTQVLFRVAQLDQNRQFRFPSCRLKDMGPEVPGMRREHIPQRFAAIQHRQAVRMRRTHPGLGKGDDRNAQIEVVIQP